MIFALLGRVRLKVLYYLFSFLISILPLKAEEIHQSPMVFEECSNKTNILMSFQLSLEKYKLDGEKYNDEYKTHIFELDHLEQRVKKLEKEVIANPSNTEFWDNYDAIYETYKGAVIKINRFEEYGDQLQLDSNQLMSKFVNLRTRFQRIVMVNGKLGSLGNIVKMVMINFYNFANNLISNNL